MPAAAAAAPRALLVTNDGALVYELEDEETGLGRAETNDIVLASSRSISSRHCSIVVRAASSSRRARCSLVDLGSLNGTFINDTRVQDACVAAQRGRCVRPRPRASLTRARPPAAQRG
jgi:pSer/pThr/pTyr-binding forkhead associated (FHA) protein